MALKADRAQIRPLRTYTSGRVPAAAEMAVGEIFINAADRTLGFKNNDNSIKYIVGKAGDGQNDVVHISGNETITGVKTFTQTIIGTSQRALWGDLAEFYLPDIQYEPGTIVEIGGDKEITAATAKVFGVVSTKPGLLINTALEEKGGIPVALIGRVPVKVLGRVDKGDYILLSQHRPGIGIASKMLRNCDKSRLVGIALKSAHVQRGKVTSVLCTVHSCIA